MDQTGGTWGGSESGKEVEVERGEIAPSTSGGFGLGRRRV